jgi:hypothetical protein
MSPDENLIVIAGIPAGAGGFVPDQDDPLRHPMGSH